MDTGSLLSRIKTYGTFTPALIAKYVRQILRGLEYLHAKQVVHCDLKAANILTNARGQVKLSDFGVSKLYSEIATGKGSQVVGSAYWIAPEVSISLSVVSLTLADYSVKGAERCL